MKIQDMKINFNALCEYEKETGKVLLDVFKSKKIGFNDLRALVKAGLDIDADEAGNLIEKFVEEKGMEEFSKLIHEKMQEFKGFREKK